MRSTNPRALPPAALSVVLVLLAGLASACGGEASGSDAAAEKEPTVTPTEEISGDPDTWPLTGLPVDDGDSAVQAHPVLVLKMDNTRASAPQRGLSAADLVVEELVEGGLTRLAAFFYSDIPGEVGPVRSMRASDIGIVAPVDGLMVTSGAAAVTISRIKDAGIDYVADGSAGFHRATDRYAPYNLMTDLDDVAAEVAGTEAGRPVDYLPFGSDAEFPDGPAAKRIDARFSGGHTTSWVLRGDQYVNENSFAAPGDEFLADTVLVLRVKVGDAGYRDPAGNPVPETELSGEGTALLFHGGRLVRGTWSKDSLEGTLALTTEDGDPLAVPAGHTWIELVPATNGDVTFQK